MPSITHHTAPHANSPAAANAASTYPLSTPPRCIDASNAAPLGIDLMQSSAAQLALPEAWRSFIATHRDEDPRTLALHLPQALFTAASIAAAPSALPLTAATLLDQIAGWRAARHKLPLWAANPSVIYPPHLSMEQCSSQVTAQYKAQLAASLLGEHLANARLIDLTGGFGVDFTIMAQKFATSVYIEEHALLSYIAAHNCRALGVRHAAAYCAEASAALHAISANATDATHAADAGDAPTLIMIDPARRDAHGARTYAIADCTPNVIELQDAMLSLADYVLIKLSPMLDWHKALADLGEHVSQVHIVAVRGECKELLMVLDRAQHSTVELHCFNDEQATHAQQSAVMAAIDATVSTDATVNTDVADNTATTTATNISSDTVFIVPTTPAAPISPTTPPEGVAMRDIAKYHFLYEPHAALMKSGCFAELGQRFHVSMLAEQSHLYVSDELCKNFPGRAFAIQAVLPLQAKQAARALKAMGVESANIAVRHAPITAERLRAKLKLRDGGATYLFATTSTDQRHALIVTTKARSIALSNTQQHLLPNDINRIKHAQSRP